MGALRAGDVQGGAERGGFIQGLFVLGAGPAVGHDAAAHREIYATGEQIRTGRARARRGVHLDDDSRRHPMLGSGNYRNRRLTKNKENNAIKITVHLRLMAYHRMSVQANWARAFADARFR